MNFVVSEWMTMLKAGDCSVVDDGTDDDKAFPSVSLKKRNHENEEGKKMGRGGV